MRFGMRQIASEVSAKHPLENRLAEVNTPPRRRYAMSEENQEQGNRTRIEPI